MGSATHEQEFLGPMREQADHASEQCSLMAHLGSSLRVSALASHDDGL